MGTRPLKNLCEIAVIGAGLAGLAAARHAARLGRLVTLFEGSGLYGGLVATVGEIDDLPVPGRFSGQDIAIALLEDARKVGVSVVEWPVARLEAGERLLLTDGSGATWHPEAAIVASGGALRLLGVPGEAEFQGRGLSRCATCDGGFYRGKAVAVVGGGDGAVHEALTLSALASQVFMVCRSPLRARREHIDRLAARGNVTFLWDSEVTAVLGENSVTGLALRHVGTGEAGEIAVAGVFPFIGLAPATDCLPAHLLTARGHVRAGADLMTGDPRILAAGAVREGFGGTATQAMAEGIGAAEAAARLLARREAERTG